MSSLWINEKNDVAHKDTENHGDEFTFGNPERKDIAAVGKILTELHGKFFEICLDVEQALHLEILSVAKEHQRRGLASRLMAKMEDPAKMREFKCSKIASEISSLANQCLMKKRGYTALTETLFASECDESGRPLIVTDDGTDRVVLVCKDF
ncbi:N-acetyltransferase domain-containing protein [Caenorhabditis elegans]|nr:N-acetyltransferase domain-containing protein [Caenorhabditis elegans]CTQ86877.1 N-acetyltransferase domain-containing protein [Caenorhabditis elegans]|eukprot:NP_001300178.1 Uncharacterized protein CELE_R13D11.4 [Caenorhabditis elegans]